MSNDPKDPRIDEIIHRLRTHGFEQQSSTIVAIALQFAEQSDEFKVAVGTFGVQLLTKAMDEFKEL